MIGAGGAGPAPKPPRTSLRSAPLRGGFDVSLAGVCSAPYGRRAVLRGRLRAGPRLPALVRFGGPRLPSSASPLATLAPLVGARGKGERCPSLRSGRFFSAGALKPSAGAGRWRSRVQRAGAGQRWRAAPRVACDARCSLRSARASHATRSALPCPSPAVRCVLATLARAPVFGFRAHAVLASFFRGPFKSVGAAVRLPLRSTKI